MESQNSVGKRIIWAVSMVVLCTFLTFFMSMFLGSAIPGLNVIYKAGIPVLVFVLLGVASFGLQSFFSNVWCYWNIPEWLVKIAPIALVGLGLLLGQFSYDEFSKEIINEAIYTGFMKDGVVYETTAFGFQSVYQSGLDFITVLFGNTVFAVSFYNRIYLMISAVFIYFALKNLCGGKTCAANLFLVFFFGAKQTMELAVIPEATLVYILMVSLFLFSASLVYYFRTRTHSLIAQVISVFVMGCMFAVLLICEANSLVLALPAIVVSFSGKNKQDARWYYILAVEGILLIFITGVLVFAMRPEYLLSFAFELPTIEKITLKTTTILFMNLLGFLSVFGMWKQKLHYVVPALMGIYFMFTGIGFAETINGEFVAFLCFALFGALGVGLLDVTELPETEEEDEYEGYEEPVNVLKTEKTQNVKKVEQVEHVEEIAEIKAINKKLNQNTPGFVPLEFKKPKEREKKVVEYAYEPKIEEMKYDIEISDDDDFDI